MPGTLTKSSLRYLIRHPWQFGLSILGIALGISIVVSIDIANYSTAEAFNLSLNSVTGKATHRISGISAGIPDSVYRKLRVEKGFRNIAPVIENYVTIDDSAKRVFSLLGVDVFAEKPFRDYLSQPDHSGGLNNFLTNGNCVILSEETAQSIGKSEGDTVILIVNSVKYPVIISGLIKNYNNKPALENLIIADISTAQEITGKKGILDCIDMITDSEVELKNISESLPMGYMIQRSTSRTDTAEQMLDAFNLNLTALSLLALIVGIFLIYNSMTFSVVQRKTIIGTLRSIGVTRTEIYTVIIKEVLIIGFIGTVLGFVLAFIITGQLISIISTTINDLYFVVRVNKIHISAFIVVKGFLTGMAASLLSAVKPAKEAAGIQPRIAMIRSEQESGLISRMPLLTVIGVCLGIAGGLILLIPSGSVWLGYIGILPVIVSFALLTPFAISVSEKIFSPVLNKLFGLTGRIASRGIIQNISRTNAAIAALGIAVAASIGVGTMIHSFRNTVVNWLNNGLKADLYISAPTIVSNTNDAVLPLKLLGQIKEIEKLSGIEFYRSMDLFQDGKKYNMISSGATDVNLIGFQIKDGNSEEALDGFKRGEALVSEPFAFRNNVKKGSVLNLKTDNGYKDFKVAGIYYNYASDQGYIAFEYSHFNKNWNAAGLSGISVFVKDEKDIPEIKNKIRNLSTGGVSLFIRTNKFLRESAIEIFDRTFLIAKVLQLLAVIVAFIGILSALMSLQLERNREYGILRANGILPSQLFRIITIQSALIGLISGILAAPLGSLLAAILVYIINKRSFGWTMQFEIDPSIMLEAVALALLAALIAGIYPGYKMSQISPALALKDE